MASHLHHDPAAPASVLQLERWLVCKKESERAFFSNFLIHISYKRLCSKFSCAFWSLYVEPFDTLVSPQILRPLLKKMYNDFHFPETEYICTGLTACFLSSLKVMSKAREEHNRGPANPKLTSEYNLWEEHWIRWIDFPTLRFYEHLNCLFETGIVRLEFIFRFFLV